MTTLLLSSNQLSSLTRTERQDYMQEVSDEIADRIKEERALLDQENFDFIGYDFSKDYDLDLNGNPIMDDDMGIFGDDYRLSHYDDFDYGNYGPLSEV